MMFSVEDDLTKIKDIEKLHIISFLYFCDYKISKNKLNKKK